MKDSRIVVRSRSLQVGPRLPLQGSIDLTYRCNNDCRHCWLRLPANDGARHDELSANEWREIVDQARRLGTRRWVISGGEPLLRPDFSEIFEYTTHRSLGYSLNTNGTLITRALAKLLKREGMKMVAVYGATADVYERATGNPGSFEALIAGLSYLREVGAGFVVQLIPMRENWSQWGAMVDFARSWSNQYRVGAAWLFKSACGDLARNESIARQRLNPESVVALDTSINFDEDARKGGRLASTVQARDDRVLADCIARHHEFHIDPYGGMSFCPFIKDPDLRMSLRSLTGSIPSESPASGENDRAAAISADAVRYVWEDFIPSLGDRVRGGPEYFEGCASCELRGDCRWCDAYGYLEHRRHGAKVEYLCEVAAENRKFREAWMSEHCRYFEIAGITVRVESDLPFTDTTFADKFARFASEGPGDDTVAIRHHFGIPELSHDTGEEVYRKPPWAIYHKGTSWIYECIPPDEDDPSLYQVAVFREDHSKGEIYNGEGRDQWWREGHLGALTMFPTDQILVARLLADRSGCFLHSGGVLIDGQGLLFVGHSEAGKSTTMQLVRRELGDRAEILCDDRNIVRRWPDGFRVHGTWSHGDVPDVSSASGPLRAILFLKQDASNEIVPCTDHRMIYRELLATLIRPLATADWWQREMDLVQQLVEEVPCYWMLFDKSGAIVPKLPRLVT